LVEGFMSDEMFDRWIVAADVVVLPYRNIWSSGVLERAQLYNVPAIVTDVGGLRHQVADRSGVAVVSTDAELRTALERRVRIPTREPQGNWPAGGSDLRERVQAEVISRALIRRGGPTAETHSAAHSTQTSLSFPIRAVPPLAPPAPISARLGATTAKRIVARATRWLFDPVFWEINALREATIRALDDIERRGDNQR
jgi:hypothetical protein